MANLFKEPFHPWGPWHKVCKLLTMRQHTHSIEYNMAMQAFVLSAPIVHSQSPCLVNSCVDLLSLSYLTRQSCEPGISKFQMPLPCLFRLLT